MKKKQQNKGSFKFHPESYPTEPGCYLMKNKKGQVIYVGKAKNLKRRLSYYFRNRRQYYKTKCMVPNIDDVEVILVNNETESLVLENNLIKHYKPKYNSMLTQDDVGYPFIVLTGEEFPRLLPYRRNWSNRQWSQTKGQSEGKRFGPYLNKNFRDAIMVFAIENWGLRICRSLPERVCLRYNLNKCSGLCEGHISPEGYREAVGQVEELLEYRHSEILSRLYKKMENCAESLDFEAAAKLRDQIVILEDFLEKQIVERDVKYDQDVLYFGNDSVMAIEIKKGMLLKTRLFILPSENNYQKACEHFLVSRYSKNCPEELIINKLNNSGVIKKQVFSNSKTPVSITFPDQGIKMDLLMLCKKNYEYYKKMAQGTGRKVKCLNSTESD